MANPDSTASVMLAGNQAASALLYTVLADAASRFEATFTPIQFPSQAGDFRKRYAQVLPQFEAARAGSSSRGDIAAHVVNAMVPQITWLDGSQETRLDEALKTPTGALKLERHQFGGRPGWRPSVVYRGERWEAHQLAELGAAMAERGVISGAARDSLAWLSETQLHNGELNLVGRKIAVMGAGAEMAPTRFWLEAGADVLWLDTVPPPQDWQTADGMSGTLYWPATNADLLSGPREVLATLIEFADGHPLDLGLYAYAPGQARELRLTSVMNAIVQALPTSLLASVTLLVSPTTPTALSQEDITLMQRRHQNRPAWEALLGGIGLLGRGGGMAMVNDTAAPRTVVGIQGASYQAAQYIGKVLTAESWAKAGEFRVSANTAAITRTRSLAHPVFTAAFGGAAAFGIETLTPRQSRRINGLLAVSDWLHPQPAFPGLVRVHGGIHTLPYPLESALRVAAAIGFARSPRLLSGLFAR